MKIVTRRIAFLLEMHFENLNSKKVKLHWFGVGQCCVLSPQPPDPISQHSTLPLLRNENSQANIIACCKVIWMVRLITLQVLRLSTNFSFQKKKIFKWNWIFGFLRSEYELFTYWISFPPKLSIYFDWKFQKCIIPFQYKNLIRKVILISKLFAKFFTTNRNTCNSMFSTMIEYLNISTNTFQR